jgi:hypothetical protein
MPVTGDPLAEIDAALVRAGTRLRGARARADTLTIQRLTAWTGYRPDQRLDCHGRRAPAPGQPPPRAGGEPSPAMIHEAPRMTQDRYRGRAGVPVSPGLRLAGGAHEVASAGPPPRERGAFGTLAPRRRPAQVAGR